MHRRVFRWPIAALVCLGWIGAGVIAGPLAAQTTAAPATESQDYLAQINDLATKIKSLQDANAAKAALDALSAAIGNVSCAANPPKDNSGTPIDCFLSTIGNLRKVIPDKLDPKKEPDKTKIAQAQQLIDALEKIVNPPDKPAEKYFINVLGAYYGDLEDIGFAFKELGDCGDSKSTCFSANPNRGQKSFDKLDTDWLRVTPALEAAAQSAKRYCSATQAVRTLCHGKDKCLETTLATPISFGGTSMCGYEPAPYADARAKALVVVYQCAGKSDYEGNNLVTRWLPHWVPKSNGALLADADKLNYEIYEAKKARDAANVKAVKAQEDFKKADVDAKNALMDVDKPNQTPAQKKVAKKVAELAQKEADDLQKKLITANREKASLEEKTKLNLGDVNKTAVAAGAKTNQDLTEREIQLAQRWAVIRPGEVSLITCNAPAAPAQAAASSNATKTSQ